MSKNNIKLVTVIYNSPALNSDRERTLGDVDTVLTAREISDALEKKGYTTELMELHSEAEVGKIKKGSLVFNMCEWTGDETYKTCKVIEELDKKGFVYTGASAKNYYETTEKIAMKKKLDDLGLATPGWQIMNDYNKDISKQLKYPMIVKLAYEHGSVGLTQNSVVENEEQLRGQVEYMVEKYKQSVLIEEFIAGREVNVTLIGNANSLRILPITEMVFGPVFMKKWNILTFSSKFLDRSKEFKDSKAVYPPVDLSAEALTSAAKISKKAFVDFDCQDYARLDIRIDAFGKPWILEVNSNPSLENAQISTIVSAGIAGWSYEDLIEQIAMAAWNRQWNEKHREASYKVV